MLAPLQVDDLDHASVVADLANPRNARMQMLGYAASRRC